MYCRNLGRALSVLALLATVFGPSPGAYSAELLWSYGTTGGYFDSSPGVGDLDSDGKLDLVATSTAGLVVALDGAGHEIWRADLGGQITTAPTVADVAGGRGLEVLVLTSFRETDTARLVCLEGLTGDVLWTHQFDSEVKWASMSIIATDLESDGRIEVLAADEKGTLVCLSGAGEFQWDYREAEGIGSAPATGDLTGDGIAEILIASNDSPLICLSAQGQELWRYRPTSDQERAGRKREVASPVIWDLDGDGANEVLTGVGRTLSAFTGTGAKRWSHPMKNRIDSSICVSDANGDGEVEIYAADLSAGFVCVSPEGKLNWSAHIGVRARRSPAIADVDADGQSEIIVAGYDRNIRVFDAAGKLEDQLPLVGGTNATATLADLLGDGSLCAIVPEISGKLLVYRWDNAIGNRPMPVSQYRMNASRTASQQNPLQRTISAGLVDVDLGNCHADSAAFRVRVANAAREPLDVSLEVTKGGQRIAELRKKVSVREDLVELPYQPSPARGGDLQLD